MKNKGSQQRQFVQFTQNGGVPGVRLDKPYEMDDWDSVPALQLGQTEMGLATLYIAVSALTFCELGTPC